jgi:hypothetical protein
MRLSTNSRRRDGRRRARIPNGLEDAHLYAQSSRFVDELGAGHFAQVGHFGSDVDGTSHELECDAAPRHVSATRWPRMHYMSTLLRWVWVLALWWGVAYLLGEPRRRWWANLRFRRALYDALVDDVPELATNPYVWRWRFQTPPWWAK